MDRIEIYPGADPRQNPMYKQLREEVSKLLLPARPDVNWALIETQCLHLFRHHGADIRSVAWFTAARLHRGGLQGLSEGLTLMDMLTARCWQVVWPQTAVSRQDALSWLADQIRHELRRIPHDTSQSTAVQSVLQSLGNITATLRAAQPSAPAVFEKVITQLVRFTRPSVNSPQQTTAGCPEWSPEPAISSSCLNHPLPDVSSDISGAVFVVRNVISDPSAPFYHQRTWWTGVIAGSLMTMMLTLMVNMFMTENQSAQDVLLKTVSLQAVPLSGEQAGALRDRLTDRQLQTLQPVLMTQAEKYLDRVVFSGPDTIQQHTQGILRQMDTLWPEDKGIRSLRQRWVRKTGEQAEPEMSHIEAWRQANEGLDALMARLNTLDGYRSRWMTESELKRAVFMVRRNLDAASPVEAHLAQIAALKRAGKAVPASLYEQAGTRLRQQQAAYLALQSVDATE